MSEAQQADYARESVQQWRSYPWAGAYLWYDLVDAGATDTVLHRYGLLRGGFDPKPAYTALQAMMAG